MLKTTVNGISLAYERGGSGVPLVLVHGFPLDHSLWELITPTLQAKADVIVPDLRGFGESFVPASDYRLTDVAADIAALLDQFQIEKAVIAGHSMGGYVALAFAHAYPERVSGLGLVSTQALADSPEKKAARYKEAEDTLANGVAKTAEGMSTKMTANPQIQQKLKETIMRQSPAGLAGALKAMAEREATLPYLAEFGFPVAIVHGLADTLIPIERAREMRSMVKKGFMVEVEGAGHVPMLEAPQVTAGELMKLLV